MITTFLFDVDGTLLDTREFIFRATEYALNKHNYPIPDRSVIAPLVGRDFDAFYHTLTGDRSRVKGLQESHRGFQFANMDLSLPYSDVIDTLKILKEKGYQLGAVTSRSRKTSLASLEVSGLLPFFDVVVSAEDAHELKPDPAPVLLALEKLGACPENAVMVGDSWLDVQAGIDAGTKTVRVLTGFHLDRVDEPRADYTIEDFGGVQDLDW